MNLLFHWGVGIRPSEFFNKMSKKLEKLGDFGQKIAEQYYTQRGWMVKDRNIHFQDSELDLIFEKNDVFRFVEVKTRNNCSDFSPFPWISKMKIRRFRKGCFHYLSNLSAKSWEMRVFCVNILSFEEKRVKCFELDETDLFSF